VKKLHLFLLLLVVAGGLKAQDNTSEVKSGVQHREQKKSKPVTTFKAQEELENVYEREFSVGARLNTDGWSGFLEKGYRSSRTKVTFFQFEFAEKKDPKEDKKSGAIKGVDQYGFVYSEKPYIYGKQNNFYQVKIGIGQQRLIGGKANKNGVLVNAFYYGGLSIGLLKPYYVNAIDPVDGVTVRTIKYGESVEYNQAFLDRDKIIGGGGFGKGWGEVSVAPGVHAKTGLRFDWARFNEVVSALEVGVNAEYYTKDVAIMVSNDPKKFFFNAYIALQFGKRWNKKK